MSITNAVEAARRQLDRPDHRPRTYDYTAAGTTGPTGRVRSRDVPRRHRALAAELAVRDDVASVRATASGVRVRAPDGLPAWVVEKAALVDVPLLDRDGAPFDVPDADALRAEREAAGLTQREVADALGIHQSIVTDLENGRRAISPTRAAKIRRVCERAGGDGS